MEKDIYNLSETQGGVEDNEREEDNVSGNEMEVEIVEHGSNNGSQLTDREISESSLDIATLMHIEEKMPEKFQEITEEEILKQISIKLIQKHIRAMRDRIFVNECMYELNNVLISTRLVLNI